MTGFKITKIVTAIFLLLALGSWPYDYYTILRIVTCVTCIWGAVKYYGMGQEGIAVLFGGLALLFNPIFLIHLERETWAVLDLLAAAVIGYSFVIDRRPNN